MAYQTVKTGSNDLAADELLSMFIYAPPEEVLDWATYDWPPSASDDASSFGSTGEFAPGPQRLRVCTSGSQTNIH